MMKEIAPWTLKGAVIAGVVLISGLDWFSGHDLSFFAFYFIPIAFAAWHLGFRFAVITALLIGIAWFCEDLFAGHHYFTSLYEVWNTTTYSAAYIVFGWAFSKQRQMLDRERQVAEELRRALSEITILETFLPICAECKKIHDNDGEWKELEVYFSQHSNTQFTHGYCLECGKLALEEADTTAMPGAEDAGDAVSFSR